MDECIINECNASIKPNKHFCSTHWMLLPYQIKVTLGVRLRNKRTPKELVDNIINSGKSYIEHNHIATNGDVK